MIVPGPEAGDASLRESERCRAWPIEQAGTKIALTRDVTEATPQIARQSAARALLVPVSPDRADHDHADGGVAGPVHLHGLSELPRRRSSAASPDFIGFDNYFTLLTDPRFWNAIGVALVFVVRSPCRSSSCSASSARSCSTRASTGARSSMPAALHADHDGAHRRRPAVEDHARGLVGPSSPTMSSSASASDRRDLGVRLARSGALRAGLRRCLAVDAVHDAGVLRRPAGAAARPYRAAAVDGANGVADFLPLDAAHDGAADGRHRAAPAHRRLQGVRHGLHAHRRRARAARRRRRACSPTR